MQEPVDPPDEAERLAALRRLNILDSPPEARFDLLTQTARTTFDVPIALVSLVDAQRQWFKSRQGLDAQETPRAISFCGHAVLSEDALVVEDAACDPRFADNPLVKGAPGIRFYAGHPLCTLDGARVGTLCLIDRSPRTLGPDQRTALRALAAAVEDELSAYRVTLGHYQLQEVIGRGGMGVVYKARDESLGRVVAIKVVHRAHACAPGFRERFRREARALAAVAHRDVMTIFEINEDRGVLYMACEYLSGGTLARRLSHTGPLPPAEVAALGARVADALAAVHRARLVHRDVKPANVFLDACGAPRLGDFGIASHRGQSWAEPLRPVLPPSDVLCGEGEATACELPALPPRSVSQGHTEDDAAARGAGTLSYMSPEQAFGREVDGRADLYSLGATLYELLTGAPPFEGSRAKVLRDLVLKAPAPLRELVPGIPPALATLVRELLAKEPDARPDDAAQVATRLAALARP